MSALAKPMIHSSRATSFSPVNAEEILTFEEVTVSTPVGAVAAKWVINFSMKAGNSPANVAWQYASLGAMNADYAAIVGLVSTVTP